MIVVLFITETNYKETLAMKPVKKMRVYGSSRRLGSGEVFVGKSGNGKSVGIRFAHKLKLNELDKGKLKREKYARVLISKGKVITRVRLSLRAALALYLLLQTELFPEQ